MKRLTVLILLVSQVALAGQSIVLEAYNDGRTVWTLEVRLKKDGCDVIGSQSLPTKHLNRQECEDLSQETSQAINQLTHQKPITSRLKDLYADDPNYDFLFNDKRYSVLLEAPKVCSTTPDGEIHCKVNDLDPEQILLITLRRFALTHNF